MKMKTKKYTYLGIETESLTIEFRKKNLADALSEATRIVRENSRYFVGWRKGSDIPHNDGLIGDENYIAINLSQILSYAREDLPLDLFNGGVPVFTGKGYTSEIIPDHETHYTQSAQIVNTGKMWSVYIHIRDIQKS